MKSALLTGTTTLVRLAVRRDRIKLPVWVFSLGILAASMARSFDAFYPSPADRAGLTASIRANPSIALLYGPAYDLSTPGGFAAWRSGGFLALLIGLFAVFTVTRHARAEEDSGRAELTGSGVVGRWAPLAAAVMVAGGASVAIGVVVGSSLMATGAGAAGSWALAAATTATGLAFAGVAAVSNQVATYSRTANGIGSAVVGGAFLLRAVGDSSSGAGWLSWGSPIGWAQHVRPFAGERWWVLVLPVALAVATSATAVVLVTRRDLGAGLLPPRPGPARAGEQLVGPFALARRLHRGVFATWLGGLVIAGAVFGSIAVGVGDIVGDSRQTREMFERLGGTHGITDAFLAVIAGVFGMVTVLYGVQTLMRLRSEEAQRAEIVLATATSRGRWLGSHLAFAFGGSAVIVVAAGAATGVTHGLRSGDVGGAVADMVVATAAQIPAIWLLIGLGAAVFGMAPRFVNLAWGLAGAALMISLFGPVVNAPHLVLDLSPFGHIPKLPGASVTALPLVVLGAVAVAGTTAGVGAFHRRDVG